MTNEPSLPDGIGFELTGTGSAADLTDFLAWVDAEFDEDEYTLSVEFATDSLDVAKGAALSSVAPSADADAHSPADADDRAQDGEEDVHAATDGEAAADTATADEGEGEALAEFSQGDRVRDTSDEDEYGVGTVDRINEKYGTIVVNFDSGAERARRAGDLVFVEETPAADEDDKPTIRINPGTRKYRVGSTLSALTRDGSKVTSRDVFDALDGTKWEEENTSKVSQGINSLRQADAVERAGRVVGRRGNLYTMTFAGEAAIADAEEEAETTFDEIRDEWVADHAADDTADESGDSDEDDTDEDADGEVPVVDRVTLNPGTWRFKVGSALYHADGPQMAEELESILSGTEWERERKQISATLGGLYRNDVATRETRETEENGANPYVYEFTDEGEALVEDTARRAVEGDDEVYADVVEVVECPDCDATFQNQGDLTSHREREHSRAYGREGSAAGSEEGNEPATEDEPADSPDEEGEDDPAETPEGGDGPAGLDALLGDGGDANEQGDLSRQFEGGEDA